VKSVFWISFKYNNIYLSYTYVCVFFFRYSQSPIMLVYILYTCTFHERVEHICRWGTSPTLAPVASNQSYHYNNNMTACFGLRPKTYTGRHSGRTLRVTDRVAVQSTVSAPAFRQTVACARVCQRPDFPCLRVTWWFRFRSLPLPVRRTCSPSVRVPRKWCTGHNYYYENSSVFYILCPSLPENNNMIHVNNDLQGLEKILCLPISGTKRWFLPTFKP